MIVRVIYRVCSVIMVVGVRMIVSHGCEGGLDLGGVEHACVVSIKGEKVELHAIKCRKLQNTNKKLKE